MKLALVAFLALCAVAVSSPVNDEKRTEEIAGLLRELLLVEEKGYDPRDAEQSLQEKAVDPLKLAINDMRWWRRFTYLVLVLKENKWIINARGAPFGKEETVETKFNEMKTYLDGEATLVIFDRSGLGIGTSKVAKPVALIEWVPENHESKVEFMAKCDEVSNMSGIKEKFIKYVWTVPDDISYEVISVPQP